MTDVPTSGLGDIPTETATSEPERAKRTKWWILAVLAVALVVVVVLIVVQVSKSGPSYRVTYTGVQAVGPNATRVSVVVRNTGGSTGTPTCTVRATANGGAELGTGTFHEDRAIKPGDVTLYVNTLSISNGAAGLLKPSDISVTCHTAK